LREPINIHSIGESLYLIKGRYRVFMIGGWGIEIGEFSISIRHSKTEALNKVKRAFWRTQTFFNGK